LKEKRRPGVDRRHQIIHSFLARAIRLYEQEPEEACASARLGSYVQLWLRWTWGGLRTTTRRRGSSHKVPDDFPGKWDYPATPDGSTMALCDTPNIKNSFCSSNAFKPAPERLCRFSCRRQGSRESSLGLFL